MDDDEESYEKKAPFLESYDDIIDTGNKITLCADKKLATLKKSDLVKFFQGDKKLDEILRTSETRFGILKENAHDLRRSLVNLSRGNLRGENCISKLFGKTSRIKIEEKEINNNLAKTLYSITIKSI
jgi:hypothetical protein